MESKLDEMRDEVVRREDMVRDEETAKQRFESARKVRARSENFNQITFHVFNRIPPHLKLVTIRGTQNYSNTNARTQHCQKRVGEREQHSRSETAERELRKRPVI